MKTGAHTIYSFQQGFTMLELVLILTLIGMVSVGLFNATTIQSIDVEPAALKVINDIRYAQDRAMITGRNHGFITNSTTQYTIYDSAPTTPATDPSTQSSMIVNLNPTYKDVAFQNSYQVEFNSLGAPVTGAGINIILSNGSVTKQFSVTNNTGLINLP